MTVLKKTNIVGRCDQLLVNSDATDITTASVDHVRVSYAGFEGDIHTSLTRSSCVRVKSQYAEGTEIRNVRQLSILSTEELVLIAQAMDIERLEPAWVGANLLLSGIPHLTQLPPSSRLIFTGGVSLVVDMENEPCRYPGEIIDQEYPGRGKLFPKSAMGLRGITAWVEREGIIKTAESVTVHLPPQRLYTAEYSFAR